MNPDPAVIAPDLGALFEFEDTRSGRRFTVSLAVLLQCLCIAEAHMTVPPFEAELEFATIPDQLRAMARTTVHTP